MHDKPRLRVTKDYDLFELHPLNRELGDKPILVESMKQHGFMPSSPIHCVENGKGRLKVIRGHNRLHYAKRLKLPVWYVIDNSNTDIYELEGDTTQRWSFHDFLISRAKAGDKDCAEVIAFSAKHGITEAQSASLLTGETAGSGNAQGKVKRGSFRIAKDTSHAEAVADIIDHCLQAGVTHATQSAFVRAISMVLRVPEFDPSLFKHRVTRTPDLIERKTNHLDYLEVIEAAYNYAAKGKRVALRFRAEEVSRARKAMLMSGRRADGTPR